MAGNDLAAKLNLTVSDAGVCEKKFEFVVSGEAMKDACGSTVAELAQAVAIPGFRRGKAPAAMVRKRYAEELKSELKRKLFQAAFQRLSQDSYDIVNWAMPEEGEFSLDQDFKFTLTLSIAPEFEVGEYTGIEVNVPEAKADDKELENRLNYYRQMYAGYADVNEPAQAEDMLKVSYTSDFELPADASPALKRQVECESNYLWLSQPESIPGSIAALTGAEVGQDYALKAEYPADYHQPELAGKTVNFKIHVLAIQRRQLLDDAALCEKLQMANIDELKARLAEAAQHEAEEARKGKVLDAVYAKLEAGIAAFELPKSLIEAEEAKELRQVANRTVKSEADAEEFKKNLDEHRRDAEKAAREKLRRLFIFRKIAKKENIAVEAGELENQIAMLSRYYGKKEKEMRQLLERNGSMEDLEMDVLNSKVWDFLASKANVKAE